MRITELFNNGEFVVTAEVGPPKGIHIDHLVEEAKEYLTKVHCVNVTDNQSSVMRMGSLPACVMLKNAGLTPILQLTCRDRNRIALQSELLGAAMLGIAAALKEPQVLEGLSGSVRLCLVPAEELLELGGVYKSLYETQFRQILDMEDEKKEENKADDK